MSDTQYIYMSWEDVEKSCVRIHEAMKSQNYTPDVIIGLLWGGVIPTRLLVDLLGHKRINTHVTYASLYDGIGKRKDTVDIGFNKDSLTTLANKKVLVVDDIWDSGMTMRAALKDLVENNCIVSTATLVYKNINSSIAPNYYDKILERDNLWVVFPWEKCEFEREMIKGAIK
jgi:uncharacterized protein